MNKIKQFLLAICIGCFAALLFNTAYPKHKYFYEYPQAYGRIPKTEITKEAYQTLVKKSPTKYRYAVERQTNIEAILIGAAGTILILVINPLKQRNA